MADFSIPTNPTPNAISPKARSCKNLIEPKSPIKPSEVDHSMSDHDPQEKFCLSRIVINALRKFVLHFGGILQRRKACSKTDKNKGFVKLHQQRIEVIQKAI